MNESQPNLIEEQQPEASRAHPIFADRAATLLLVKASLKATGEKRTVSLELAAPVIDDGALAGLPESFAAQWAVMSNLSGPCRADFPHEIKERNVELFSWSAPPAGPLEAFEKVGGLALRAVTISKFRMECDDKRRVFLFLTLSDVGLGDAGHWAVDHLGRSLFWRVTDSNGTLFHQEQDPLATIADDFRRKMQKGMGAQDAVSITDPEGNGIRITKDDVQRVRGIGTAKK